jgi:hypothetical protein
MASTLRTFALSTLMLGALTTLPALAATADAQQRAAAMVCLPPLATGIAQESAPPPAVAAARLPESAACLARPARVGEMQRAEIRLRVVDGSGNAVAAVPLHFRPSSGSIVGDTTTSASGEVSVLWFRVAHADSAGIVARITVHADTPAGPLVQFIEVRPITTELTIRLAQSFPRAAFVNTPLRRPGIVEIMTVVGGNSIPISDPEICRAQRVTFRKEGDAGTLTPDTAAGTVYRARERQSIFHEWNNAQDKFGCFATAAWQTSASTGRQRVHATLIPGPEYRTAAPRMTSIAVVRPAPRFVLGAVGRWDHSYFGSDEGTPRTYRVERLLPNGEKALFDSVATPVSVDSVNGWSIATMAGVSVPIPFRSDSRFRRVAEHVTLTVGVDPADPRKDQYAGLSLLPFVQSFPETFPLQLDLLAHFGKIPELVSPQNCAALTGPDPCETDSRHGFRGMALSLSFDASTLLADVIKKLGQ